MEEDMLRHHEERLAAIQALRIEVAATEKIAAYHRHYDTVSRDTHRRYIEQLWWFCCPSFDFCFRFSSSVLLQTGARWRSSYKQLSNPAVHLVCTAEIRRSSSCGISSLVILHHGTGPALDNFKASLDEDRDQLLIAAIDAIPEVKKFQSLCFVVATSVLRSL